ncbi:AAA family ATPase [Geomonas oryzae]|uniref:AAA family ATPase n=1 Tax=Geomonas oryzae TaxID=2364273 RepID=UPI00100C1EE9|nr:AAA family ATPase [Geomonas oryzae]
MIIKALTLENFKGISEPVRIEFKPITLLYGPNSAGKSTIVQAIHYAREVLDRNNIDADITQQGGEFVDLGGFRNFVHGHEIERKVKLSFELNLANAVIPTYHDIALDNIIEGQGPIPECDLSYLVKTAAIGLTITWSAQFKRPYVSEYRSWINGEEFACITADPDGKWVKISEINFLNPLFVLQSDAYGTGNPSTPLLEIYDLAFPNKFKGDYSQVDIPLYGQKLAIPNWGRELLIGQERSITEARDMEVESLSVLQFAAILSQLVVGTGELLLNELRKFRYLGPIREIPPRNYEAPRFHEHARWSNGLAAWDVLNNAGDNFVEKISSWMAGRLNTGYSVGLRRYREIEYGSRLHSLLISGGLLDEDEDTVRRMYEECPEQGQVILKMNDKLNVMPQDVGIGISQVLPAIVAALAGIDLLVAIEQPELHIHPRLQAELGDLFLEAALRDAGNFFIIETHSEHLLLRIMRRMREYASGGSDTPSSLHPTPEAVGVWYVDADDGQTMVREMPLNEFGKLIKPWPGGFFEEGLREVF